MRFISPILFISALLIGGLSGISPASATTTPASGTLIRSTSYPAVYFMGADGFRYVFPNEATYFTWYENFNTVQWITDAELAAIQIGGNVTYKPGERMLKIQSDPKTYAVSQNGTLRWVTSESVATSLYGASWNSKIDDLPDSFFANYTIGEPIMSSGDYDVNDEQGSVTTINEDKNLSAAQTVSSSSDYSDGYSPSSLTIDAGEVVRFVNDDDVNHTATATDGSWGSGTLEPGETFLRRFDEPGTYAYFCSYHPDDMQGVIIVE